MTNLPCEQAIGSTAVVPAGSTVLFGRVALPTGRALQVAPSGESDPKTRLFAKDGLLIQRNAEFDLVVPSEWMGRLQIGWGSPAKRTSHLHVPVCWPHETSNPLKPSDPWIVYAGGYWVPIPACTQLTVQAAESKETVSIGVGAACPGDSAPPS